MSGHTPLPAEPLDLPMLPLRDVVVFPHMVIPLFVGRPKSIKALESAMLTDRRIMLVAQKTAAKDEPEATDMFEVGCVSTILQMLKLPDGTVKVLVEGQQRAAGHLDAAPAENGPAHRPQPARLQLQADQLGIPVSRPVGCSPRCFRVALR